MSYNAPGSGGQFAQNGQYNHNPYPNPSHGQPYAPPGIPGQGASNVGPPPGMPHPAAAQGFGAPNMPNLNWNAPVIRMGTDSGRDSQAPGHSSSSNAEPLGGARRGVGHGDRSYENRHTPLVAQSFEEERRTIMIANLTEIWGSDQDIEKVLSAGQPHGFRRFFRMDDSYGNNSLYGWAEYNDTDALCSAIEILKHAKLPNPEFKKDVKKEVAVKMEDESKNDENVEKNVEEDVEMNGASNKETSSEDSKGLNEPFVSMKTIVDQKTLDFIKSYEHSRDSAKVAVTIEEGIAELQNILKDYRKNSNGDNQTSVNSLTGEVVNVSISANADEDYFEKLDPAVRTRVRSEIAAFRKRAAERDSTKKERDRLLQEQVRREFMEKLTKTAEELPDAKPAAPRDAPSGPRGPNNSSEFDSSTSQWTLRPITSDDINGGFSDQQIEQRRQEDLNQRKHAAFLKAEAAYQLKERRRLESIARERASEIKLEKDRIDIRKRNEDFFNTWDDDVDSGEGRRYRDSLYNPERYFHALSKKRSREIDFDEQDVRKERAEKAARRVEAGEGMEDAGEERKALKQSETDFRIDFGKANRERQAREEAANKAVRGIENLLDNTEEERRPLRLRRLADEGDKPVDNVNPAKKLADSIPLEKAALFAWKVQHDHINEAMVANKIRPYVVKQVDNVIGQPEEYLIDLIIRGVQQKTPPQAISDEIAVAVKDKDAADEMVQKVWRGLVFFTESEKLGIETA